MIIAAAFASMGFALSAASSKDLPSGVTLHQVRAADLDESGWVFAKSTAGAYTVNIPCPSEYITLDSPKENDSSQYSNMLGCKADNGLLYTVIRLFYGGGAGEALGAFSNDSLTILSIMASSVTEGMSKGTNYKQFGVILNGKCAETRVVNAGRSNVILTVESAPVGCFDIKHDASKFFDSLSIEK